MRLRLASHSLLLITVICPLSFAGLTASAQVIYETRALTGDAAPDTSNGVVFSGFGTPVLNDSGDVAFKGFLVGAGVAGANNSGVWSGSKDSLGLIVRVGDISPDSSPVVVYRQINNPNLSNSGEIAFSGRDFASPDDGIWSNSGGFLGLVAREGAAAPGTGSGVVFHRMIGPAINSLGETALYGVLRGTDVDQTNDHGIWSELGSSLDLVVRAGDAAPGTESGVVFNFLSNSPVINDLGVTAFSSTLTGTEIDETNGNGIWSGSAGSLVLVARAGHAVPGTRPGVLFADFGDPRINNASNTVFSASLSGTGVDGANDSGIWSESNGSLALVIRAGDAAPGVAPGVIFAEFGTTVINGSGDTAFSATLAGTNVDGTNDDSVWAEKNGLLQLVARAGDVAPGTNSGVIFSSFSGLTTNESGDIAFLGTIRGPGVLRGADRGIWAMDRDGLFQLIVREGDLFDINDDPLTEDLRMISNVTSFLSSGGEDGRVSSLNNNGQIAFELEFDDDTSGIFVATIPEPTSLALLGLGGLALIRRR